MTYISQLNFKNNIVPHKLNLLYAGCGTGKTEWATRKINGITTKLTKLT